MIISVKMEIKNIIFYYPSKITGGAEYLFMRCSDYLAKHQDRYSIYYVDYEDGFARNNLHSEKIAFIDYKKEERVLIPNNSAVIVQLDRISQIESCFEYDQEQTVFLFWCLHSLNIKYQIISYGHYFLLPKERKRLGEAISMLSKMNVIKYMGYGANILVLKELFQKPQILEWLPNMLPIDKPLPPPCFIKPSTDNIKFCWLGRFDYEKARNIITYMNELEECYKHYHLSLSLIGNGRAYEYLSQQARQYSYPISFVGEKRDKELDEYIREYVDIGLASGTSAYEFSLRGKPVIMERVIDRIYKACERNYYTFTFSESIGFDDKTGELIREDQNYFMAKLDDLLNNYEDISKKCYDYVLSKSPSNCTTILLKTIEKISELNQDDVRQQVQLASALINKAKWRINLLHRFIHPFSKS